MSRERRKSERLRVDLKVDYSCEDTSLFTFMTDISPVGVFIRSGNPYPVGTRLMLRFRLPGKKQPLIVEGEVTWTQMERSEQPHRPHPGMGIRFVGLTEVAQQQLENLL